MKTLRIAAFLVSVVIAAACAPLVALTAYVANGPTADERAADLLARQAASWSDPLLREQTTAALRSNNPEWDFMRRTFLVLAAADRALLHPDEAEVWLPLMDSVIADTLSDEAEHGQAHFLLSYAHHRPWIGDGRSLFVDGEVAMMIGARRLVRDDDPRLRALHAERIAWIDRAFAAAPQGLPESYPDEAWLFCVTNALVALRMADHLDGSDHGPGIDGWVALARRSMIHEPSGLLGSEFRVDGAMLDGPEGSSLWLVVTNLALLDPVIAVEQYDLAVDALVRQVGGHAWAREWGPGWRGVEDIDSGPIVPVVEASPSSSGFALVASRAFGDESLHRALVRSLRAADLLMVFDPRLRDLAGNPMGDVIILHGLQSGALWDRLRQAPRG